jgi:hypothetical protein
MKKYRKWFLLSYSVNFDEKNEKFLKIFENHREKGEQSVNCQFVHV